MIVNKEDGLVVIAKKDANIWSKLGDFLPENFEKTLEKIRTDSRSRFKEVGIEKYLVKE